MNLKEHFMNPKNFGKIKKTEYVGKSKSGFCGDTIEVYLDVQAGKIKDAKYQACGCWALIGSASALSEYAKDKMLEELQCLSDEEYLAILGDVPQEKQDCVMVTKRAFMQAVEGK